MTATEAHPRRWAGLAVLAASLLVVMMDMTILNVALPELARDVQPTSVELLWIVAPTVTYEELAMASPPSACRG